MDRAAESIVEDSSSGGSSDDDLPPLRPKKSPYGVPLRQIYASLTTGAASQSKKSQRQSLLTLNRYLEDTEERTVKEDSDDEFVDKMLLWVSKLILPDEGLSPGNDIPDGGLPVHDFEERLLNYVPGGNSSISKPQSLHHTREVAISGLNTISNLQNLYNTPHLNLPINTITCLLAYTSARDPWTSSTSLMLSKELLSKYADQISSQTFITTTILQETIRPLFSASRSSRITPAGRKAMPSSTPARRFETVGEERMTKPWMYEAPWAVAVFDWAVRSVNTESISSALPLLLPPLLAVLDSPLTPYRSRGLHILCTLLSKFPTKLLQQTGLGEVFEDAIMPTLLYLPNLTPLEESVELLEPAYDALFLLAETRFEGDQIERIRFWDGVIRKGILTGYDHAIEHPRIIEILIRKMGRILETVGIHAVKHLKSILPILSSILTNPFTTSTPTLLHTTLITLRTVILTCWPRIPYHSHRLEILKALVICWRTLSHDSISHSTEDEAVLRKAKEELKVVGRVFVKAVEAGNESHIRAEIRLIMEVDECGVDEVFGM